MNWKSGLTAMLVVAAVLAMMAVIFGAVSLVMFVAEWNGAAAFALGLVEGMGFVFFVGALDDGYDS